MKGKLPKRLADRRKPNGLGKSQGIRAKTGHRVGEWHQRVKWPDQKVREVCSEYRRGVRGFGYASIGHRHGIPWETVRDMVNGGTRWTAHQ